MSVTCGRSVVFSRHSGFLHQWNWPTRYNWNIVQSGIKHHNPNPNHIIYIPCTSSSISRTTDPATLVASHLYNPASEAFVLSISSTPSANCVIPSSFLLTSLSSLYHTIVGVGVPTAGQTKVTGSPSMTSVFVGKSWGNSGGAVKLLFINIEKVETV